METEAATTTVLSDWKLEQKHVLRELPSLLQPIAHHLDHLESAAKCLWDLSQTDDADQSIGHSPNGWSALESLAEYGRYKPVELNIRMAEVIARFTQLPGAFDKRHTPLDLEDKLLAKEGQFTDQDGFTISIGAFPFNYPVIKPARDRALALVEEGLNSENLRVARRAVQSTANILSGFLPMMGRQLGEEEVAWQNAEREVVLQMLEKRLQKSPLPVPLLRKIRSVLLRARPWTRDIPITTRIDEVLAAAPQTDDVLIFDALWSSPWDHDARYETVEQADEARRDLIQRAVSAFRGRYKSPADQIAALVQLAADAESAGIDRGGKCGDFVEKLCLDSAFTDEFIRYLLGDPDPFLGQLISVPLAASRSLDAARYEEVGLRGAAHEIVSVGLGTAAAVCYGPPLTDPIPEDLAIIEALSDHPNAWVRHNTFLGIRRIGAHQEYERDAVRLAIEISIDDSSVLAEEMCGVFGPGGVNFEHLTEDDARAILQKLARLKELDRHDTTRFLGQAGRTYPTLVFSFLMQRLDRAAEILARGESLKGYVPIPGNHVGGALHSLQNGPDYPNFMAQVRDKFINQPDLRYWLGQIFWDIGMVDATTLSIIDELVHSADKETVRAGIGLLSGAPSGVALSRPQFAVHIIETCGEMDRDLAVRASAGFIGNAHTGAFQRTPGFPSPKFQQMAQRATALQDLFPPGTVGHEFFSKLRESAEAVLEHERVDDEEFGFG